MIRFWIVLSVGLFPVLGRRIGGEERRLESRGWQDNRLKEERFKSWLNDGNDAVLAADEEALRRIEQKIDKLEEAEEEVEADIEKRLQYQTVDDEDILHYLGEEGSGRRMYNM